MRPLPDALPAANSAKWHSRRNWDSLGYLRVRTLSNPAFQPDVRGLTRWLRRDMEALDQPYDWRPTVAGEREMYAAALKRLADYPRTAEGEVSPDAAWDQVLDAVDAILVARQAAHLSARRVPEDPRQ